MPAGGKTLAALRQQRKRPEGFIVVTDDRSVARHFRNPLRSMCVLTFEPGKVYDWRVLHRLDVALITSSKREDVADICRAILEVEPLSFAANYHGDPVPRDVIIPLRVACSQSLTTT